MSIRRFIILRAPAFVVLVAASASFTIAASSCGRKKNESQGASQSPASSSAAASIGSRSPDESDDSDESDESDETNDARTPGVASAGGEAGTKPELSTTLMSSTIWEKPSYESLPLGTLRAGNRVQYVPEPFEGRGAQPCGGKWYAVEPRGWVCAGKDGVTTELADPRVTLAAAFAGNDEPLPYAYGMSYGSPMYARVPTPQEQKDSEGDVEYWRKTIAAVRAKTPPEKLGPELALPVTEMPAFLANHAQAPPLLLWLQPNKTARAGYALPQSRLAFVSAFESDGRNFYLTSELAVVPTDRFKVAHANDFRGVELAPAGRPGEHLPMIWVRFPTDKPSGTGPGPYVYELHGESTLVKTMMQLAIQSHYEVAPADVMVKNVRHHELTTLPAGLEAKEGVRYLVRTTEVTKIDALKAAPDKIAADEYWIDVDLGRQTLVAYEGTKPKYVTLVSGGAGGKGRSTPYGTFRIYQKHFTARMSADEKPAEKAGEEGERAYRFDDVPWVQYLYAGIALHGAFWHDNFGQPRSHGCVNLSPFDARYLFKRTVPALPAGWHGVNAGRGGVELGTFVVIHG